MNAKQFSVGEWRVAPLLDEISRESQTIKLEPRLMRLLTLLASRPGEVVTIEEILETVWPGVIVTQSSVYNSIASLRRVLGDVDNEPRYIATVSKRGYRLIAPVVESKSSQAVVDGAPATGGVASGTPARPRPERRPIWLSLGAFAIAGIALLTWWTLREPSLPYAKRDWLLVANFENQTGEANLEQALLTAFTVSLEQSTYVNVFPRSRIATTLERMKKPTDSKIDEALAREICIRQGLRALIAPSISRTGNEYAVAAQLINPKTGNTVRAYLLRAPDATRILQTLQELAAQVRHDLGESINEIDANNRPLDHVTTASLEALQQYSMGQYLIGRAQYAEASRHFEAAVRTDPEFAMAYAELAKLKYSSQVNRPKLGAEYFQRALDLSTRTTGRERLVIAADFAASKGQLNEAQELYAAFAAAYPDDLKMHTRMGALLLNTGMYSEAAAAYQSAAEIDPESAATWYNLGVARVNANQFAAALAAVERTKRIEPAFVTQGLNGFTYAFIVFAAGNEKAAIEHFEATAANPSGKARGNRGLGLIELYHGRYSSAVVRFREATEAAARAQENHLNRSRHFGFLAATLSAQGQKEEAAKALDEAVSHLDAWGPVQLGFRSRFVGAFIRLGNIKAAQKQVELIAKNAEINGPRDQATLKFVLGEIELAGGNIKKAIDLFQSAYQGQPANELPIILDRMASAHESNGDRQQAIRTYQTLVDMRGRCLAWEAQEIWLLSHFQLARLLHQNGENREAKKSLQPLLDAWIDSDQGLPAAIAMRKLDSDIDAALAGKREISAATL